jgi:hypothetical protein
MVFLIRENLKVENTVNFSDKKNTSNFVGKRNT